MKHFILIASFVVITALSLSLLAAMCCGYDNVYVVVSWIVSTILKYVSIVYEINLCIKEDETY